MSAAGVHVDALACDVREAYRLVVAAARPGDDGRTRVRVDVGALPLGAHPHACEPVDRDAFTILDLLPVAYSRVYEVYRQPGRPARARLHVITDGEYLSIHVPAPDTGTSG